MCRKVKFPSLPYILHQHYLRELSCKPQMWATYAILSFWVIILKKEMKQIKLILLIFIYYIKYMIILILSIWKQKWDVFHPYSYSNYSKSGEYIYNSSEFGLPHFKCSTVTCSSDHYTWWQNFTLKHLGIIIKDEIILTITYQWK